MFSGVRKCRKTEPAQPIQEKTERLKELLWQADAVLTGAGAGLSTSAGFTYSGERFRMYFSDFEKKYGFHDMYSGGFYPYASPEEYSTNVDHCFQKAGFEKKRLFYTQGDYGLFQCSEPCCQETWENEEIIDRMVREQSDMRVPAGLVPRCPHCGRPMTMNLRADDSFVQVEGWYRAAERYQDFLRRHAHGRILYLELGVGYNTPVLCVLSASLKPKTITIKQQILCQFVNNSNTKERRCA